MAQFTSLTIDTIFNLYKPKSPLSKFVDSLWLHEGREAEHQTERILPTSTLEPVINLRQNELRFYDDERRENCSRFSGAIGFAQILLTPEGVCESQPMVAKAILPVSKTKSGRV